MMIDYENQTNILINYLFVTLFQSGIVAAGLGLAAIGFAGLWPFRASFLYARFTNFGYVKSKVKVSYLCNQIFLN